LEIFGQRLVGGLFILGASRYIVEQLERLWLASRRGKYDTINAERLTYLPAYLGLASQLSGKLRDSIYYLRSVFEGYEMLDSDTDEDGGVSELVVRTLLSSSLCASGMLTEAEQEACRALIVELRRHPIVSKPYAFAYLSLTAAVTGNTVESKAALKHILESDELTTEPDEQDSMILVRANSALSQLSVWMQDPDVARSSASRAAQWAQRSLFRSTDPIHAVRLQGTVALAAADLIRADEHLHHALSLAREVSLVEEELAALIALAELQRRKGDQTGAREFLEDAWELAERGPFVLLHADAYNVLAQIERDAGNHTAAVDAATNAYRLAWCDGPPFAYHWGLTTARRHLHKLSESEPRMPPFDPDKHEPMLEVQIEQNDTDRDRTADTT
jgi:tetratricopeptide (TPR) repeat protein